MTVFVEVGFFMLETCILQLETGNFLFTDPRPPISDP